MTEKLAQFELDGNLDLWTQVSVTDPKITKKIVKGKGFTLTAIDAQSQIKKATEMFGPYGTGWGLKDLRWETIADCPDLSRVLHATFWYPGGKFEISSDMPYVSKGECHKKLQTDATTKALSKLGFNSDVFEGKFDDNRYIAELERANATHKEIPKPPTMKPSSASYMRAHHAILNPSPKDGQTELHFIDKCIARAEEVTAKGDISGAELLNLKELAGKQRDKHLKAKARRPETQEMEAHF
jgi:hypothetical protein